MNRYVFIEMSTQTPFERVLQILEAEEFPESKPADVPGRWYEIAFDTVVHLGWKAEKPGDEWVFSEPSYQDYVDLNAITVRTRLGFAAAWLNANPVHYKVNLGIATPAEEAAWITYQQYYIAVCDVKLQADYPYTVNWPVAPF